MQSAAARDSLDAKAIPTDEQTSDPATHHEVTIADFGPYRPIYRRR